MAISGRIRETYILGIIALVSCIGSIGLTLALTSLPVVQSTATGNAGQAYGAAAAATSVIVLAYIARTFRHQGDEARKNRELLSLQREDTQGQHEMALQRSAQATIQGQHLKLLQMAIDDPLLMQCWPNYSPIDASDELRRQFMYCNLIISHHYMTYELGHFNDQEVEESLRYIFKSEAVRSFWENSRPSRSRTAPYGGLMRKFYDMAEVAYLSNTGV